jgi:hypothetical protein
MLIKCTPTIRLVDQPLELVEVLVVVAVVVVHFLQILVLLVQVLDLHLYYHRLLLLDPLPPYLVLEVVGQVEQGVVVVS